MKKIITTLLLLSLFLQIPASAEPAKDIPPKLQRAFLKIYPSAQYAKWETLYQKELYVVWFVYKNETQLAYFTYSGKQVASCRTIKIEELPLPVKLSVQQISAVGYIVKGEELIMNDELHYFFESYKNQQRKKIQITSDGIIREIK
jgi:hypothetical protein